mgnify:CR=1 FL=1
MNLPIHILEILNKKSNEIVEGSKSNCFWATQYFFDPSVFPPKLLNGNEILKFISEKCIQVEEPNSSDIFIIWSSSETRLSPDKIDVHYLSTIPEGFPFGLIIEHSGVFLKNEQIFQKASPKEDDKFEIIDKGLAFACYDHLPWIRKTFHRYIR